VGQGRRHRGRELLYDSSGNLVGSDQAIATSMDDPLFTAYNTPQGFTSGLFSGEFDLFGPES
jgi:hypothetical protein